jgi:hypothetical protein
MIYECDHFGCALGGFIACIETNERRLLATRFLVLHCYLATKHKHEKIRIVTRSYIHYISREQSMFSVLLATRFNRF